MAMKLFLNITRGKLIRQLSYEHTRFRKKPNIKSTEKLRNLQDSSRVFDFNAW
jgi:hypothetical protein